MATDNNVILKELYPKIEKSLSNKETVHKVKMAIANYIDSNTMKLTTAGPQYRVIFHENEYIRFYNIIGIDPNEVRAMLKRSTYIKNQWQIMNNPFNSIAAMCIRFFKIHKDEELARAMVVYLTLSMYPSLHYKYFEFEPNPQIMEYTINNLSNKYKVKNSNCIFEALVDTTLLSDKTYTKNLIRATDKDITDYIQAYKTRLNSMIRKIANEFYKNEKKKLYLNEDIESNGEDNYKSIDNDTMIVDRLANTASSNILIHGPDMRLINIAAKIADISVNELRNTVNSILNDPDNRTDVHNINSAILFLFIFDSKMNREKVGTKDFVVYSLEIYKRANTADKNVVIIKNSLDKWLEKYSITYRRTQRVATLNNFRRALFLFFVLTIQQNSK